MHHPFIALCGTDTDLYWLILDDHESIARSILRTVDGTKYDYSRAVEREKGRTPSKTDTTTDSLVLFTMLIVRELAAFLSTSELAIIFNPFTVSPRAPQV
jgi:hypothetical protein